PSRAMPPQTPPAARTSRPRCNNPPDRSQRSLRLLLTSSRGTDDHVQTTESRRHGVCFGQKKKYLRASVPPWFVRDSSGYPGCGLFDNAAASDGAVVRTADHEPPDRPPPRRR